MSNVAADSQAVADDFTHGILKEGKPYGDRGLRFFHELMAA
jgi:hypothetical protein